MLVKNVLYVLYLDKTFNPKFLFSNGGFLHNFKGID